MAKDVVQSADAPSIDTRHGRAALRLTARIVSQHDVDD